MNPRLYFDEKTLKKLGDVFVVNTYFPIKYTTLIIQAEN